MLWRGFQARFVLSQGRPELFHGAQPLIPDMCSMASALITEAYSSDAPLSKRIFLTMGITRHLHFPFRSALYR
jgi:hypothetical protein